MPGLISGVAGTKYHQLRNILQEKIRNGEHKVGDRLGTEAELTKRYRLSSTTVIRVLREMERDGLVVRKTGGGTFVRSREPITPVVANSQTLLLSGRAIIRSLEEHDLNQAVNWFIGYEIHRGVINNFSGHVRLVYDTELLALSRETGSKRFCVILSNPTATVVESLQSAGVPYISIDSRVGITRTERNTVTLDRLRGIYEGVAYLIRDLGHREIAFITAGQGEHSDRVFGYTSTLQAFDIPYREELVAHDLEGGSLDAGYKAMKRLMESKVPFSAVFADTDMKALGAIKALQEAGLRVPEDVSVMGFDDAPGTEEASPALTTIRVPHYEMGAEAIRLLEERLAHGGADVPGSLLNTRLVIRASCGPRKEGGG